jgi:predicted amidophosphoribosyltransferase
VMTTGATARECSRVLLEAGASRVEVAVLGRARLHGI